MIVDSIDHHTLYTKLSPMLNKAFDYLTKTDFSQLPYGKHLIEGEDLFVIYQTYESKAPAECKMENHKQYIDIQFIVNGEELIGTATFNNQVPVITYDENKDVAFYDNQHDSIIKLQARQFAIFFPHDLHRPCMRTDKVSTVNKAVIKIRVASI
jgi:YhcH/YjgK/YiaL family protein